MFRFANLGRAWVPVMLPQRDVVGEDDTAPTVKVFFLVRLLDGDELAARDKDVMARTAAGFVERAKHAKTVDDLMAVLEETTRVKQEDLQDLLERTSDWHGFADEHDTPLEFTPERMAALLRFDFIFRRVRNALFDYSREGVAKN